MKEQEIEFLQKFFRQVVTERPLERIAMTHEASLGDDTLLPKLAHFLETGMVLCYRNGSEWYDVHPLIREIVIEQAARIKRTRANAQAGNPSA